LTAVSLEEVLRQIQPVSLDASVQAQARLDSQTKPPSSLGRLEEIVRRVAAIHDDQPVRVSKKSVYIFAADHGVVQEGVSAYPAEVTPQMVLNFLNGGAAINCLARHVGADVKVVDIGVNHDFKNVAGLIHKKIAHGTQNMSRTTAMTVEQARASIHTGIELAYEAIDAGYDLLAVGEMGIGNTTPATALMCVYGSVKASEIIGRGTGVDDAGLKRKIDAIESALQLHQPNPGDPLATLAQIGGFEIGAMAGFIIGCAVRRKPCIIDGLISGAGAVLAMQFQPLIRDYIFASHRSCEAGHETFFKLSGQTPLFDLGLRLGEGTGAVLAMQLIEAAIKIYNEMATFDSAGISGKTPEPVKTGLS